MSRAPGRSRGSSNSEGSDTKLGSRGVAEVLGQASFCTRLNFLKLLEFSLAVVFVVQYAIKSGLSKRMV